jgi:hypothetical protein
VPVYAKKKPAPNHSRHRPKVAGGKPATGRLCQAGLRDKASVRRTRPGENTSFRNSFLINPMHQNRPEQGDGIRPRICRQNIYLWRPQWQPNKPLNRLGFLPCQADMVSPNSEWYS